jgi:hypothetical protein
MSTSSINRKHERGCLRDERSGFSKASEIDRNDLLEYKEKKINKRVPLVLTYHPSLKKIFRHCPSSLERNSKK